METLDIRVVRAKEERKKLSGAGLFLPFFRYRIRNKIAFVFSKRTVVKDYVSSAQFISPTLIQQLFSKLTEKEIKKSNLRRSISTNIIIMSLYFSKKKKGLILFTID